jgi:hypothetical protein
MSQLPTHEAWQVILGLNNGLLMKKVMTKEYLEKFGTNYEKDVKCSCLKCFVDKGYITCKGKESFKTTATGDQAYRKYIRDAKPDEPFC